MSNSPSTRTRLAVAFALSLCAAIAWLTAHIRWRNVWFGRWTVVTPAADVSAVALSPEGDLLAVAVSDRTVKLFELQSPAMFTPFTGHTGWIRSLAFSSDGSRLASAADDGEVKMWDVAAGKLLQTFRAPNPVAVAFTRDDALEVEQANGAIRDLWPTDSPSPIRKLPCAQRWEIAGAIALPGCRSRDGSVLACRSRGSERIRLFDAKSCQPIAEVNDQARLVSAAAFAWDGSMLALGHGEGEVTVWLVRTGELYRRLKPPSMGSNISAVSFSADGVLVAAACGNAVHIWNTFAGDYLANLKMMTPEEDGGVCEDWIIMTPAGDYACSPRVRRLIRWGGADLFRAGGAARLRYRPNRVRHALRED